MLNLFPTVLTFSEVPGFSSLNWTFLESLEVIYPVIVAMTKAESQEIKHTDPQDLGTSPLFH